MAKRILLVDDEPTLILKGLRYTLEQEGYESTSRLADGEGSVAGLF